MTGFQICRGRKLPSCTSSPPSTASSGLSSQRMATGFTISAPLTETSRMVHRPDEAGVSCFTSQTVPESRPGISDEARPSSVTCVEPTSNASVRPLVGPFDVSERSMPTT